MKKHMVKFLFLIFQCTVLSACFGFVSVREEVRSVDMPKDGIYFGAKKANVWCQHEPPCAEQKIENATQVKDIWGEPARIERKDGLEHWYYRRELGWSGIVVVAIVPLPILIPVGFRHTILTFSNGKLIETQAEEGELGNPLLLCGIMLKAHYDWGPGCDGEL